MNPTTTTDHEDLDPARPPFRPLTPAYLVTSLLVGLVSLSSTFVGVPLVGSMAAHPETWLYIGLAVIAVVSVTLALLALRHEAEAAALRAENSALQAQIRQVRNETTAVRQREQLDRIETTLESLKTPRTQWWKRGSR